MEKFKRIFKDIIIITALLLITIFIGKELYFKDIDEQKTANKEVSKKSQDNIVSNSIIGSQNRILLAVGEQETFYYNFYYELYYGINYGTGSIYLTNIDTEIYFYSVSNDGSGEREIDNFSYSLEFYEERITNEYSLLFNIYTEEITTGIFSLFYDVEFTNGTIVFDPDFQSGRIQYKYIYDYYSFNIPILNELTRDWGNYLIDNSYNSGYTNGENEGFNSGYTTGKNEGFNSGYNKGFSDGEKVFDTNFLSEIFSETNDFFNIEIFPNLKLWYIIAGPLIVALIIAVLKVLR